MPAIPGGFLRHQVTIEPYQGEGANGPVYGAPVTVRAFVDETTRTVRGSDATTTTSSATFYARLDTVAPQQSRVTLADGRKTTVLAALRRDGGGFAVPDHLEVQLV
jgi:hypothetical protein